MALNKINELFNNRKARKFFLKIRLPLFAVFLLLLVFLVKPRWFVPGLIVSVLGEILQVWCFSTIKTKKEVTRSGPYMFVRNPMYIGRFFLIFGMLLMTGSIWLLAGFAVLYYFYMTNRVKREEETLSRIFGSEYEKYCMEVNRYIPTFRSFAPEKLAYLSSESFIKNHAHLNIIAVILAYSVLYWAAFIRPS